MSRLRQVIDRIDAENASDPAQLEVDGEPVPKEMLYARRMTAALEKLQPDADEAVEIAVRAQHLRRFDIPRDTYPEGRKGYHRWRTDLAKHHAAAATAIMADAGYDEQTVERVRSMILKRGLKTDPDVQLLEDVACVVFLEHYFAEFAAKHDDDKVVDILRKTWAKMSARGHEAARALSFGDRETALLRRALSAGDASPAAGS